MRSFLRFLLVVHFLFLPARAVAATFSVTTSSGGGGVQACAEDTANPKTKCSLAEAFEVATTNGESDTINLAAGSGANYSITNNSSPNFPFGASASDGSSLTIAGAGMGKTILDGAGVN